MDKIYLHKLIKMAIAAPLVFSLGTVLGISPALSFLPPLFAFLTICQFPDPIGLKRVLSVQFIASTIPTLLAGAFFVGLWGIDSVTLFLIVLLLGLGLQTWNPSLFRLGLFPIVMFLLTIPLTAANPYTIAVDLVLMMTIGAGFGWLVDRLFWPVFGEQGIEQKVSTTFRTLQEMSDRAFHEVELSDGYLANLAARVDDSLRAANKALKVATMTRSLATSDQSEWAQAIALQSELLVHLLAISRLLQENQENPLLHELTPELSALGDRLSATLAGLSAAIVSQPSTIQLPNPTVALQRWQTRLRGMRTGGATQSFDLSSRIAVELLEQHLEGLVTDLSKSLTWVGARYSAVSADLPIVLNPAQ